MQTTATMIIHYSRDPREITVDKPHGTWMQLDAFLLALGFRKARENGRLIEGRFTFWTGSPEEQEQVVDILRLGGAYLTSGNFEETCSV